ncbi:MAG: AMP-binding protein [Nocardia sp.]|nr:AMP-binding protein [Nocardia sp.]
MQELTFHRLLFRVREQFPRRILYIDPDGEYTAADHIDTTLRLAGGLRALLEPRDRIAIVADANRLVVNVFHAAAMGSFVAVPLNPRFGEAELGALLADSAPRAVVTDRAHLDRVAAALRVAGLTPVILLTDDPPPGDCAATVLRLADVIGGAELEIPTEPEESMPLLMLYTGGTTGRSRGAMAEHRQLVLSLHRLDAMLRISEPGSCLLSVNPLFHVAMINAVFAFPAYGGTVVMRPRLDIDRAMSDVREHSVTHLGAVAAILQRIIDHPDFDAAGFDSVREVMYGASPMPTRLLHRIRDSFPQASIRHNYGMTETFGSVTSLDDTDHRRGGARLQSVGRALPGVRLTIRDPDGMPVPAGTVGEIWLQSGSVCTRYWNDRSPGEHEWLRTGDAGHVDADGYLFLADRLKDMVKTGGENVFSAEVERAIAEHPDIEAVAVVGVPDARWGERVHAEVVACAGAQLTEADVIGFARQRLSTFKVPKTVTLRSTPLPVSALGKVLKRILREEVSSRTAEPAGTPPVD